VPERTLIPLGEGVYTVREACRILQPTMTRAKVHYWLDTGLLSEPPVAHRGKGVPTLLSFRQLLELRTVQYMRDELRISLPRVRQAFEWVLANVFTDSPSDVSFERGQGGTVIVRHGPEAIEIPTGQEAFVVDVHGLTREAGTVRAAWLQHSYDIPRWMHLVANARVLAGTPTIRGTRIDTAVVAAMVNGEGWDDADVADIVRAYPQLTAEAVREALEFEGRPRRAA
jgi:uncharacterized protein (DUF433 family)